MNADTIRNKDIFQIFKYLQSQNQFDERLWRKIHCACVRDIWSYVEDARSRCAVEIAERYVNGMADEQSVLDGFAAAVNAADEAWRIVRSLREPSGPNEWEWSVSQQIDEAWSRYCAASAAKNCLLLADSAVLITTVPDSAASVRPWVNARIDVLARQPGLSGESLRMEVIRRWEQIKSEEEARQIRMLFDILEATAGT